MRTIEDAVFLIRDWTQWSGCDAWKSMLRMADDAHKIAAYADARPSSHVNRFSGERDGGPENAAKARKAEKQYRLAAWVLKRIAEGRDEHDARVAAETQAAVGAAHLIGRYKLGLGDLLFTYVDGLKKEDLE